jgi:hypothetical protein
MSYYASSAPQLPRVNLDENLHATIGRIKFIDRVPPSIEQDFLKEFRLQLDSLDTLSGLLDFCRTNISTNVWNCNMAAKLIRVLTDLDAPFVCIRRVFELNEDKADSTALYTSYITSAGKRKEFNEATRAFYKYLRVKLKRVEVEKSFMNAMGYFNDVEVLEATVRAAKVRFGKVEDIYI